MSVRPSILLIEQNAILLMRYEYSGKSLYQIPGGNMTNLETPEEVIHRELYEELNIRVKAEHLLYCAQTINTKKKKNTIHLIFSGALISGQPKLNAEHTSAVEVVWVPFFQISNVQLYPDIRQALFEQTFQNKFVCTKYLGLLNQRWL